MMATGRSGVSAAATYFLSLLRIVAGSLFFCHGVQKLLGVWGGHKVPLVAFLGLAALLEFIGGLLLITGLFTRVVSFILCGEMATAYFMAHGSKGGIPIQNGGELAVLYCFLFLYFVFAGAGGFSLDALLRKKA